MFSISIPVKCHAKRTIRCWIMAFSKKTSVRHPGMLRSRNQCWSRSHSSRFRTSEILVSVSCELVSRSLLSNRSLAPESYAYSLAIILEWSLNICTIVQFSIHAKFGLVSYLLHLLTGVNFTCCVAWPMTSRDPDRANSWPQTPNVDISLQSGQFWATSIASFGERLLDFRYNTIQYDFNNKLTNRSLTII